MRTQTVIQALSAAFMARANCERDLNQGCHESFIPLRQEWSARWMERIESLCADCLPHGSGFDCGVKLDMDASKPRKLVFIAEYHPMNGAGFYEAWTAARVIVVPDFEGFTITARGAGQHNEYIAETMHEHLSADAPALVIAKEA